MLLRYIELHNQGVRSGDFSGMLNLFAPDAVMRFEGIAFGPLRGVEAIRDAFGTNPPDDELCLITEPAEDVGSFAYSWRQAPGMRAGRLRLIERGSRIAELIITREPIPHAG